MKSACLCHFVNKSAVYLKVNWGQRAKAWVRATTGGEEMLILVDSNKPLLRSLKRLGVSESFEQVCEDGVFVRALSISRPNEIKPIQKELIYCV